MKITILFEILSHDGDTQVGGVYVDEKAAKTRADADNAQTGACIWYTETHEVIMAEIDPIVGPYCCEAWEKARCPSTARAAWPAHDNKGASELIWVEDGRCFMGNIGDATQLPALRLCPWCGHDWAKKNPCT